MKRLIFAALAFVALAQPAFSETMQRPSGAIVPSAALMCPNGTTNADGSQQVVPCGGSSVPIQVGGTFSATISGFTPGLTFATLTATNVSASVALPAGTTVVFQNTGTTAVSCTLGVGAATATANEIIVQPGSSRPVVVGTNTFGACIDQSGSVSNLVVLMGGSGLDTGFGGGGSGGSGGTVTQGSPGASPWLMTGSGTAGAAAAGVLTVQGIAGGTPLPANTTFTGSDGSASITTGGTAQNLFSGATPAHGFEVCNPDPSEDMWISQSVTAVANGQGSIRIAANGGCYSTPSSMAPFHAVSAIAATTAHKITAISW